MNIATMTSQEIRQLLERFYNAETSKQEESMLKTFFQNEAVPQEFETDRMLFNQLYNENPEQPQDIDTRIEQNIDRWNILEKNLQRKARTVSMRRVAAVAASMLIIFTIGTYMGKRTTAYNNFATNIKETYDDPHDAAGETERALTKFSTAINKGLGKIGNIETNERQ